MKQNNSNTIEEINQVKNTIQEKIKYSRLTKNQRLNLQKFYNSQVVEIFEEKRKKINLSEIARKLNVHKSTILRELKNGLFPYRSPKTSGAEIILYDACTAQMKSDKNKTRRNCKTKLTSSSNEIKFFKKVIEQYNISPEAALYLYNKTAIKPCPVSLKTIYKYIRHKILNIKSDYVHLRIIDKKAPKEGKRQQSGPNIAERPDEAAKRSEFGHFEGDLIVGARGASKECLLTLCDRKTRFLLAIKILDKSSKSVVNAIDNLETRLGTKLFKKVFKTITFDNGTEFSDYAGLCRSIKDLPKGVIDNSEKKTQETKRVLVYYANAYHSWERGTNENHNKQIRRYIPKKSDIGEISQNTIDEIVNKINYKYRKLFNAKSSIDKLQNEFDETNKLLKLLTIKNPFVKVKKIASMYKLLAD